MIGFCADVRKKEETKVTEIHKDAFLQFDSGRHVSFNDANLHTLVLGTTGSGKTRSVLLPALKRHIEAGNAGLIEDIKGNFSDYVRAMAVACGRENDIVEFGIGSAASPINLLETMEPDGAYNFFFGLIEKQIGGRSGNMDFHSRGATQGADIFRMLRDLARWQRRTSNARTVSPCLPLILDCFSDPAAASRLFTQYVAKVADRNDEETRKYIARVQNSRFHVLNQAGKERGSTINQQEQIAYATNQIISAIRGFLDERGIQEKFCGNCAPALYMDKLIRDGKIIILRFGTAAGRAAAYISRVITNAFYETIFDIGLANPAPRFVCIDEFQEVADLSSGKNSDFNFVSLAREFGCGFMAATQSLSALAAKSSAECMEGFVSNCNQKIMLFSDDTLTRELARRYDPNVDLLQLKPDEAFAVTYDVETRKHAWGLDELSLSYASCADVIPVRGKPVKAKFPEISIERIMDILEKAQKEPAQKEGKKEEPAMDGRVTEMANRGMRAGAQHGSAPHDIDEECMVEEWMAAVMNGDEEDEDDGDKPGVPDQMEHDRPEDLKVDYPLLFTNDADIFIPRGWRPYVKRVLDMYSRLEAPDRIKSLNMEQDHMTARGELCRNSPGIPFLNDLLQYTRNFCILCGNPRDDSVKMPLCGKCLEPLDLPKVDRKEEDAFPGTEDFDD